MPYDKSSSMPFKTLILLFAVLFSVVNVCSQSNHYKASKTKKVNLVHTKLDVKFNIPESLLYGEAWITMTPHFATIEKIDLDAKGMIIHELTVNNVKKPYNYFENKELNIELDRSYKKGEEFEVYIKYIAQPDEYARKTGAPKGLYFIDPNDVDPKKPTQIWTEGETENNSVWFPTIDSPNQKSTQEITITVPNEYVTLSNGKLISQSDNSDGTRSDYWKQELPHAPYLFFMGIGEFSIVKDSWNDIPVHYYVEKEYENVAMDIFGDTPEMLQFYEDKLGVEYPWDKYHQIVVRDYISGAMENTGAVIHGDDAYQSKGALADVNTQERTIAHEIIHHWFGDLVTAESWSNLTLNEAFASYGEYLWFEHKYGKNRAEELYYGDKQNYFSDKENEHKDLIRFTYADSEEMFDRVTYEKGGIVLHMLRDYLGDDMFFNGLKHYLTLHQYKSAEAHDLRLALEEVSGKDLNWFFNQWFFGSDHPKLRANTVIGEFNDIVTVSLYQSENIFQFPLKIDVYEKDGRKASHTVWVNQKEHSFSFSTDSKPSLVLLNPDGILLSEIKHNKTLDEFINQYKYSKHFEARKEALEYIAKNQDNKAAFRAMELALNDSSATLQEFVLNNLDLSNKYAKIDAIKKVEQLSKSAKATKVRAAANVTLAKLFDPVYVPQFIAAINSDSYKIIESGVIALYHHDREKTFEMIEQLDEDVKSYLSEIITGYYIDTRDEKYMPYIARHLSKGIFFTNDNKINTKYLSAFHWISQSDNEEAIQNLVDDFVSTGIRYKSYDADVAVINMFRQMVGTQKKLANSNKNELIYIIRTGISQLTN